MRKLLLLAAAAFSMGTGTGFGSDTVVLRGGLRIDLKQPWVQQGNNALLTRTDGTLLSVPVTEIDHGATARARTAPAPVRPAVVAPPSSAADAVRTGREPRARVRVTDADVAHAEMPVLTNGGEKEKDGRVGVARVEIGEYTQQKSGINIVLAGSLLNPGTAAVTNTRLMVTAVDEAGASIGSAPATVSNGSIEGGKSVAFAASVPVGDRPVAHFRFSPSWNPPPAPAPAAGVSGPGLAPAAGAGETASPAAGVPAPRPTPYGQGTIYAAPAGNSPSVAPADGKTGYIPGAAHPDNQPRPPR